MPMGKMKAHQPMLNGRRPQCAPRRLAIISSHHTPNPHNSSPAKIQELYEPHKSPSQLFPQPVLQNLKPDKGRVLLSAGLHGLHQPPNVLTTSLKQTACFFKGTTSDNKFISINNEVAAKANGMLHYQQVQGACAHLLAGPHQPPTAQN